MDQAPLLHHPELLRDPTRRPVVRMDDRHQAREPAMVTADLHRNPRGPSGVVDGHHLHGLRNTVSGDGRRKRTGDPPLRLAPDAPNGPSGSHHVMPDNTRYVN
jgi:hypothetical protein